MYDQRHILDLLDGGTVEEVRDTAQEAARAGQKRLGIELYRCLLRERDAQRKFSTRVSYGSLTLLAERIERDPELLAVGP